jgi:diguanylate cyclase (GGDEF)-like protein/PAS domain S-box-containing protein
LTYRQLIERSGFKVDTAESIKAALSATEQKRYDLVIVDYFLPDGNGEELCRRLSERPGAPVLAIITGTYREDIIRRCIEAGASECLFKNEARELTVARVRTLARQIQMQKSIEAERQRLDGILGSVGDGVYGVNNDGLITFINPTGLRLLDFVDEAELVDKPAHATIHYALADGSRPQAQDSVLGRAYIEGRSLAEHETLFFKKSGDGIPVECTLLPLTIQQRRQGSVVVFRDISARKSAERMRWESTHDALTGLINLREFQRALGQELERRRSEASGYAAVLHIDIDRYSYIVDTLGAADAEHLLIDAAGVIGKYVRNGDVLARIEGDQFALLLAGVQLETLYALADGFREVLHQCSYVAHGCERSMTASVGVAVVSRDAASVEHLLEQASRACKTAKQRGRDQTEIYAGESDARIAHALSAGWTGRLRQALDQERFVLLVQPIVPLAALPAAADAIPMRDGWRINGSGGAQSEFLFEVLIRMVGNDGSWISPRAFVPPAERAGMMPKIDLWVIQRLLRHMATLKNIQRNIAFNVNLSNSTLSDVQSLSLLEAMVRESGALARQLVFEITETSELTKMQAARAFILDLKKLGCRFALDDFGTGFSSFTHLRHLPVDFVKIDGSFVEGMSGSELDRKMVGSITQLAQSLNLKVVGEHVDRGATLSALRDSGADYAQGDYLGEPKLLAEMDFGALFAAL